MMGLVSLVPLNAGGQTVAYIGGALTVLPLSGLTLPREITVDSAGNLFVVNATNISIQIQPVLVEYPKTPSGYGPGVTLPVSSYTFALDQDDNIFFFDSSHSLSELPKTASGYGAAVSLPIDSSGVMTGLAVDSLGNLLVLINTDSGAGSIDWSVIELPKTQTGYGSQITAASGSFSILSGISASYEVVMTLDSLNDLYIGMGISYFAPNSTSSEIVELPRTSTGYGFQIQVPSVGLGFVSQMAVDSTGDLFAVDSGDRVVEFRKAPTGYEPMFVVANNIGGGTGLAVDNAGNLYISNHGGSKILEVPQVQTPINFGEAYACVPGQSQPTPCSQTLTLNYRFGAHVMLGAPEVVSFNTPDPNFILTSGSSCVGPQTGGGRCSLTVTFAPQVVGTRSGIVEIVDSTGNLLASTPITGLGLSTTDVPQAQITPSLQFGTLPYGSSETLPVTVTNIGGRTLNVTSASINARSFTIVGNTCTTGVTSGQSCTLLIQFDPINIAAFANTLTIQTNEPSPTHMVTLEAIASGITAANAPLEFGAVPYGSKSVLLLTVGNHWLPGAVTLQATASGSSYTVLNNAQNTCLAGIVSGGRCTLPVQFAPNGVGEHNGILTLTPTGGGVPITVSLYGSGSGIFAGTQYLQFGTIPLGSTAVLTLTVTNYGLPGTVMLGAAASGPSYTVLNNANNTCQAGIASGQSCNLLIQFSPVGAGGHNGILTLTPSAGAASVTIALKGAATIP
jgi:hypothetical protein